MLIAGDFPWSDESVDIWRRISFFGSRSFHVPPEDASPSQPGKLVVTGNSRLQPVLLYQEVLEYREWLVAIPIHFWPAQVIVGKAIKELEILV